MYKVFVNDKPLFLTNEISKETNFQLFLLESVDIEQLIVKIFQNKIQKAYLYHPDEKENNENPEIQNFCFQSGRWIGLQQKRRSFIHFQGWKMGFAKGGTEKGEDIEATAIREVEEETGVNQLRITKKLQKTYHVFKRNGVYKLKITQWFEMHTDFEGMPVGQVEEGIEKAVWLSPKEMPDVLKKSYENIKLLFEEENISLK